MVRERPAAERAHQARARPASVPGQVPAPAGRGPDRQALPAGRPGARSVLRLRDDARGGRRAGPRRGGLRHLGLQRAARAREDARARRRRGRRGARRHARSRRGADGRGARGRAGVSGRVVRRGRPAGAAGLPPGDRARQRLVRARLARADARRALGTARAPRRARRRARARAGAVLVPQAPPHLPADDRRPALPAPLLARRRRARRHVLRAAPCRRRGRGAPPRRPRPAPGASRPTRSSPRRRTSA